MELSLRASPQQDDLNGLKHDQHIETERGILDIEKIVLQFFARVLKRVAVLILHLGPSRNTRTHRVTHSVIRNFPAQPLHKFGPFRAGPDESHVPLQHAPQLRDLAEPGRSQNTPHSPNARIVVRSPSRARIRFRLLPHPSQLEALKLGASQAYS